MHALPNDRPSNALKCDCGCGAFSVPNRMVFVSANAHTRIDSGAEHVGIRQRWHVRKNCEAGFLRDLELTAAMNTLAMRLEEAPFWRRLPHAWAVYSGAYNMALRVQGPKRARVGAFKFVCLVILPERVSTALTAYWKGRHQRRSPNVAPTILPAPPSE